MKIQKNLVRTALVGALLFAGVSVVGAAPASAGPLDPGPVLKGPNPWFTHSICDRYPWICELTIDEREFPPVGPECLSCPFEGLEIDDVVVQPAFDRNVAQIRQFDRVAFAR